MKLKRLAQQEQKEKIRLWTVVKIGTAAFSRNIKLPFWKSLGLVLYLLLLIVWISQPLWSETKSHYAVDTASHTRHTWFLTYFLSSLISFFSLCACIQTCTEAYEKNTQLLRMVNERLPPSGVSFSWLSSPWSHWHGDLLNLVVISWTLCFVLMNC